MKLSKKIVSVLLTFTIALGSFSVFSIFKNSSSKGSSSNRNDGIDFSGLTMACLGDSITMANEDDNGKPYSYFVKNKLGLSQVYNYGIGWSTIGYMENCSCHEDDPTYDHNPFVYRYEKMLQADIIAVKGGLNDASVGMPIGTINDQEPTTFYGALNILADGLKKTYPNSYIFFMTPFKYENNPTLLSYSNAIKEVCEKYDIDCLDIYTRLPFDRTQHTTDGVHPKEEFIEELFAPLIVSFIKHNYE